MSAIEPAKETAAGSVAAAEKIADLLVGYSIEIAPRVAVDVDMLAQIPQATRIYVPHIEGTTVGEVVAAARRFRQKGFAVMVHVPARSVRDKGKLKDVLRAYREEADVSEALVLAGAMQPAGQFVNSIQLLQTGLFEDLGFSRLHVAGHPERNPLSDPAGSSRVSDEALLWKQRYAVTTGTTMAIVTQFVFDAAPIVSWSLRLKSMGVTMPIHVGLAGPAKITTLIKYSLACGVGPSLRVLQSRAADVMRLLMPYDPREIVSALARHKGDRPDSLIETVHFFSFGGVQRTVDWANVAAGR